MKDLYAYLLVRTDLPSLGRGKAHAHAMHAGNQLTWREVYQVFKSGKEVDPDVLAWHESANGFGTTVALGDKNQMDLATVNAVVHAARGLGFVADVVVDPTYPYLVDKEIVPLMDASKHTLPPANGPLGQMICFREEITTAYVFGEKEPLKVLLRSFGLVPND